jgi:hypothetical protein
MDRKRSLNPLEPSDSADVRRIVRAMREGRVYATEEAGRWRVRIPFLTGAGKHLNLEVRIDQAGDVHIVEPPMLAADDGR